MGMNMNLNEIRDKIIESVLPSVAFDGWNMASLEDAARQSGLDSDVVHAVFPGGVSEAVGHFSDWADRRMLDALACENIEDLRIRDRIRCAVFARLGVLTPHKEAVKLAMSYWLLPARSGQAGRSIWSSADCIWNWAGDQSTDYNHYTKRGLLCGVLSSTTLAWLNDDSDDMAVTAEFLDRRIENVMKLGRFIGRFKKAS